MIDTHTHLYLKQFNEDIDEVIKRAINNGVDKFIFPAIDSSYSKQMQDLQSRYSKNIYLMSGLHPVSVKENYKEELLHVKKWIDKRPFYAIGEIGIDLYWDTTYLAEQQEAFQTQIQWAKEKKLPIVIHCRDAFDEIFDILELEKGPDLYGIFHCFTGSLEQAEKAISYNMKLGIGGVATFKNGKINTFLNQISLKHIVLETDAPYLSPVPFRGKRNESSYITYVVDKLATIYDVSFEEIVTITTKNSKEVFGI